MHDARHSALRWAALALLLSASGARAQPIAPIPPAPGAPAAPFRAGAATAPHGVDPRTPPSSAALAADAATIGLAAAPGLEGLRGGGDAAPVCRAQCAPAFYTCVSTGVEGGGCHLALAACRRSCDVGEPPPGRLQSPLPAAGLAPAGALRPLPGGLPPLR
ncbi:MAG: hypothetical protein INR64_03320 [Caulobacteraceae bacterium]|nr:hypothetical protein [Caulobacter sp.]